MLASDEAAARTYGELMGDRKELGLPISVPDGQIAAIARHNHFAVATRNVPDFENCGIEVINPSRHVCGGRGRVARNLCAGGVGAGAAGGVGGSDAGVAGRVSRSMKGIALGTGALWRWLAVGSEIIEIEAPAPALHDGQIAAIARHNHFAAATGNALDIEHCGVEVINPFEFAD